MSSSDDLKYPRQEAANDRAPGAEPVASVLLDGDAAAVDETSANEANINETIAEPFSSDNSMPHEFTFFQKKKRAVSVVLAPSVAYASTAQVTAFVARFDSVVKINHKTQRHIAELKILMSDVARTMAANASKPTRKSLRRSKWLFCGCLVGFGVGWFLLFPSGHSLLTKIATFMAK